MKKILISVVTMVLLNFGLYAEENVKIKLQNKFETEHFIFYFGEEKEKLQDIFLVLEKNYDDITSKFEVTIKDKVEVYIYPTINDYQMNEFGQKLEEWIVGNYNFNNKRLNMVSPNNPGKMHDYNSMIKVAVHEFVHCVTAKVTDEFYDLPKWLSEGIAGYFSNQMNEGVRYRIKMLVESKVIPSLHDLDGEDFAYSNGYEFSNTVAEFIVKKYGQKKLIEFIKEPKLYKKAFSITNKEFEKKWKEYLEEEYK